MKHPFTSLGTIFVLSAILGAAVMDTRAATPGSVVISAAEIDYPPFCMVDETGEAHGFSVELMRAALAAMNRPVTFRTGPWHQVRTWLETGQVDALPLVGRTPEREALFDFTFPYMSLYGAIVVRQDTPGIQRLNDLTGRRVAVMKGDNAEEFLRREDRGIDIITRPSFAVALRELAEGLHDAVFIQRLVAIRLIQEAGITGLKISPQPVGAYRQDFCFAVKDGDRETLALLNEGLALVMADGTFRRLHAKWFAALQLPVDRPVIIGGDHNYPPFEFINEKGKPDGFMVELTRAIAREMNMDIQIKLKPWSDAVHALESGEIDAIQGMFYSAERDRTLDFSPWHMMSHYVGVVAGDGATPPETIADLAALSLVVQRGDVILDFLAEHDLMSRVTVLENLDEVLLALSEGRFDCALAPRISTLHIIREKGWTDLKPGRRYFFAGEYSYAVKKGHQALLTQLSEGLNTLKQTGEYRRIHDKWLGVYEEDSFHLGRILHYLAMVTLPLILILAAMFLWFRALRRQVAHKTRELKDSVEFQQAMVACSPVALYSIDLDGKVLTWNESARNIFGWPADEVLGRPLPIVPEDRQPEFEEFRSQVITRGAFTGREVVRIKKDGTRFEASLSAAPIRDSKGNMIGIMGALEDITKRKQSRLHIQHLNQVLRAVRDINQLIVHERDRDTLIREGCRLLVANRGYPSAMIVLTDENLAPKSWAMAGMVEGSKEMDDLLSRGQLPQCCVQAEQSMKTVVNHDPKTNCEGCPVSRTCADQLTVCVPLSHMKDIFGCLCVSSEIKIAQGDEEYLLLNEMSQDLAYALSSLKIESEWQQQESAREKLQAQLNQAQKMDSVGRLAGGVAHDFNNMLNVIIGYAELGQLKTTPENPLHANLQEILDAARRSSDIVRQLLAFARKQTIQPLVLDLNQVIEGTLKMLRRLIGENITLHWQPGSDLRSVYMDATQMDQILANLLVNAKDAIDGVGEVTIETCSITLDETYCAIHAEVTPGDFVMLAVSDNGCGMDRHTREKLFEPFFSTKKKGKGTGLGLATVYGIVKQNKGFINVYSEPGAGTTFRIYLPSHDKQEEAGVPEQEMPLPTVRGETILVVEDEKSILKLAQKMLENLGYQVIAVSDPLEALARIQDHDTQIHLLLTDVVMPNMNGRDLSIQVQDRYPDIKVLFMSGYTANVIAHHGILDTGVNFIQKPFFNRDLAIKIRALLDGKGH